MSHKHASSRQLQDLQLLLLLNPALQEHLEASPLQPTARALPQWAELQGEGRPVTTATRRAASAPSNESRARLKQTDGATSATRRPLVPAATRGPAPTSRGPAPTTRAPLPPSSSASTTRGPAPTSRAPAPRAPPRGTSSSGVSRSASPTRASSSKAQGSSQSGRVLASKGKGAGPSSPTALPASKRRAGKPIQPVPPMARPANGRAGGIAGKPAVAAASSAAAAAAAAASTTAVSSGATETTSAEATRAAGGAGEAQVTAATQTLEAPEAETVDVPGGQEPEVQPAEPPVGGASVAEVEAESGPPSHPATSYSPPQEPSSPHSPPQDPSPSHSPPQEPSAPHSPPQEPSLSHSPPQDPSAPHGPPQDPSAPLELHTEDPQQTAACGVVLELAAYADLTLATNGSGSNHGNQEDEDEGCSQQVSLSEMSGTQPTEEAGLEGEEGEESRPGSSLWRAAVALDSEDASGSQQGVLEGTESTDELGADASLKGPDEGPSAGSPDFERVPDIHADEEDEDEEEEEEDEEDDNDRVCDMDVGSERTDASLRRHADGDEEEDVEMASEAVTESGLESYGNADDDEQELLDDEHLDNLQHLSQPWGAPAESLPHPWAQPRPFLPGPPAEPSHFLSDPEPLEPDTPTQDLPTDPRTPTTSDLTTYDLMTSAPPAQDLHPLAPGLVPSEEALSLAAPPNGASLPSPELGTPGCSPLEGVHQEAEAVAEATAGAVVCPLTPSVLPDIVLATSSSWAGSSPAAAVPGSPVSSATEDEASDTEGEMLLGEEPVEGEESVEKQTSLGPLEEDEEQEPTTPGIAGPVIASVITSATTPSTITTSPSELEADPTSSCLAYHGSRSPGLLPLEEESSSCPTTEDPKEPPSAPEPQAEGPCPGEGVGQVLLTPPGLEQPVYMQCGSQAPYPECKKAESSIEGADQLGELQGFLQLCPAPVFNGSRPLEAEPTAPPQPYFATFGEATDDPLAGWDVVMAMPRPRLRASRTNQTLAPQPQSPMPPPALPRLPAGDLPPRVCGGGANVQLRRLQEHQRHLEEMERLRRQREERVRTPQDTCDHVTPQDTCDHVTPQDTCDHVTPQDTCDHVTPQDTCDHVTPQDTCDHVTPQDTCDHMTPQDTCDHVTLQDTCDHVTLQDTCDHVTLQDTCDHVTLQDTCDHVTLQDTCDHVTPQDTCDHMTLQDTCDGRTEEQDDNAEAKKNFHREEEVKKEERSEEWRRDLLTLQLQQQQHHTHDLTTHDALGPQQSHDALGPQQSHDALGPQQPHDAPQQSHDAPQQQPHDAPQQSHDAPQQQPHDALGPQQQESDQRQQIRLWQQELEEQNRAEARTGEPPDPNRTQPHPPVPVAPLISPSAPSTLGTIYEALEGEMEEEEEERGGKRDMEEEEERGEKRDMEEEEEGAEGNDGADQGHGRQESSCSSASLPTTPPEQDYISQNSLLSDTASPSSPEQDYSDDVCSQRLHLRRPLVGQNGGAHPRAQGQEEEVMSRELEWGSKAGLVQQLISQTLLLVKAGSEGGVRGLGEGLSQGGGGTLSPLESSHWPQLLLSPLSNPSATATVTAVSSYAPQTHGNTQPQGEWTVVEVETHH
ncbi:hypothetical protein ACEWY4_017084 [Coilia grayii]|uniref:BTB/POZ domain-containing protein n=1 Tax=Coilia grayii TaxID=363190 RepID=A0ABD1JI46_9TELE